MPRPMQRSRPANRPGQTRGGRRGQLEAFERRAAEAANATAARAGQVGPIELPSVVSVSDLAGLLGVPVTQVIKTLFTNGTVATINQALDYDTAAIVATDLGFEVREQGVATAAVATATTAAPPPTTVLCPRPVKLLTTLAQRACRSSSRSTKSISPRPIRIASSKSWLTWEWWSQSTAATSKPSRSRPERRQVSPRCSKPFSWWPRPKSNPGLIQ